MKEGSGSISPGGSSGKNVMLAEHIIKGWQVINRSTTEYIAEVTDWPKDSVGAHELSIGHSSSPETGLSVQQGPIGWAKGTRGAH